MIIKLKNTTVSDITINDLGLIIPALSDVTVSGQNADNSISRDELGDSIDLKTLMIAGDILMNDGENPGNFDLSDRYGSFSFSISGNLRPTQGEIDGYRIMTEKGEIVRVILSLSRRGNANKDTIFDICKAEPGADLSTQVNNPIFTTIYSTVTNKPKIVGDNSDYYDSAIIECALPDDVSFNFGDMFYIGINQTAKKSKDASLTVIYKIV